MRKDSNGICEFSRKKEKYMFLKNEKIRKDDIRKIFDIRASYIDTSYEDFSMKMNENKEICFVAYDEDELVGYCIGESTSKKRIWVLLDEIATNINKRKDYERKGIGSRLIREFEKAVWKQGFQAIGLGSSDKYPVEQFYLKNGYIPTEVVGRDDNGVELFREKIDNYESGAILKEELKKEYNLKEASMIFEKYRERK